MKLSTKLFTLGAGVLLSVSAFANDAIVGKWKMSEKGEEKSHHYHQSSWQRLSRCDDTRLNR